MDEMKSLEFKLFIKDLAAERAEEILAERERTKLIKKLFAVGTPIKFILQATGLTEAELYKILADETPDDSEVR